MKAKIVALPVIQEIPVISLQPVGTDSFFDHNCFGFCLMGILDKNITWHSPPLTSSKKGKITAFQKKGWMDNSTSTFTQLSKKDYAQTVIMDWDTRGAAPGFNTIFQETEENGGYLLCLNDRSNKGHMVSVKYRDNTWSFMDPTVVHADGKTGYLHSHLTADGVMAAPSGQELKFFPDFLLSLYPNTARLKVLYIERITHTA